MFNELIEQFCEAQRVASDAYRACGIAEAHVFDDGDDSTFTATECRSDWKAGRELRGFCDRLATRITFLAQRRFAPAGINLSIDRDIELEHAEISIRDSVQVGEPPDLDAYWAHLEQNFSGEAGQKLAWTQAAKSIVRGFGLRPDLEIHRTASAIVLDMRVGSEATYRSSRRTRRRASSYSDQTVGTTLAALSAFAHKHGFNALHRQLAGSGLSRHEYVTREKVCFAGLDIVLFNDRWQFRFSHQVGDALSLFIREFAADYLASLAR